MILGLRYSHTNSRRHSYRDFLYTIDECHCEQSLHKHDHQHAAFRLLGRCSRKNSDTNDRLRWMLSEHHVRCEGLFWRRSSVLQRQEDVCQCTSHDNCDILLYWNIAHVLRHFMRLVVLAKRTSCWSDRWL